MSVVKKGEIMAEKKPVYIRCPRCELNFILKKDKLCSVCKAELTSKGEDYIDDLDLELCPICKTNYIQADEVMCASCMKERALDSELHGDVDHSDDWDAYINRDDDEYIAPDEETGDMAVVSSLDDDDDLLDADDLGFDEEEPDEDEDEEEEGEDDLDDLDDLDDDDDDDYLVDDDDDED